jgi:hypothetical protein
LTFCSGDASTSTASLCAASLSTTVSFSFFGRGAIDNAGDVIRCGCIITSLPYPAI